MENKNTIQNEIMETCPSLMQVRETNAYSVPVAYFTDLTGSIMQKIKSGKEPVYYFSAKNPFSVPHNYFKNLPENILRMVIAGKEHSEVFKEMEEISPLLNTISRKPVFKVPDDYFSANRPFPAIKKQQAKVVYVKKASKLFNYAVAAVIMFVMGTAAYLLIQKEPVLNQTVLRNTMSQMKNLSDADIIEYLKTNASADDVTAKSFRANTNETEIKKSVSVMTDQEIKEFLQENGESEEI